MPLPAAPEPAPQPIQQVVIQKQEISSVMLAAFSALGYAVSARFLVFLSLIGAFVLATMAMISHDFMGLAVLALYCLLTVIPLVIVELRSKPRA